jgi:hypothetical protein
MTGRRVVVSSPPMARRLLLFAFLLVPALVLLLNYGLFQQPLDTVIDRDDRNRGMTLRAHWRWYVDPTVLVYDVQDAAADTKGVDVLRAFLQFAYRQKDRTFGRVMLAWRGTNRFYITGADFAELGRQYPYRSPVDAMVVIPPMVHRLDGSKAFPPRTALPWLEQQQQVLIDFNRFINTWAGQGAR